MALKEMFFAAGYDHTGEKYQPRHIYSAKVGRMALLTTRLPGTDEPWTGGVQGIVMTKPEAPFGLPLDSDQWLYYLTLAVTVILTLLIGNLIASCSGRAIMAIRDNPVAARTIGIDTALFKSLTFGVSALYAGIAGAIGAIVIQFVAPDSFTIHLSISLLIGVVVGSVNWIPGAFIGGAVVMFVPNIAESVSKGLSGMVYGLMLIFLTYLMPSGGRGLFNAMIRWFNYKKKNG